MTAIRLSAAPTVAGVPKHVVRRRLGWGLFCGVYWGDQKKKWQFEGLRDTKQAALDISTDQCLSREARPVYASTKINVGHHSTPRFVRVDTRFQ